MSTSVIVQSADIDAASTSTACVSSVELPPDSVSEVHYVQSIPRGPLRYIGVHMREQKNT